MRTIIRRLALVDLELFQRWARTSSPVADQVLPRLTRAANHSVLWLVLAGALAGTGGERGRRAAARGVASIALTSGAVNGPVKWVFRRTRPPIDYVPLARRLARQPVSASFPSGHSASAAAFATAVGTEWPALAAPLGVAALGVAWSRVHTGVHYPSDCVVGMGLGVAAATVVRRRWPTTPVAPAREFTAAEVPRSADGAGLTVVVNAASGSSADAGEVVRRRLPAAEVVEAGEGADVAELLRRAAEAAEILGVAGGDGTVGTAAQIAADRAVPLLVLPCGTLNHFARQLGIVTVEDALQAYESGTAAVVDLGEAAGLPFVNTASIGGYARMVPRREALEGRIGKWPALVVALVWTLLTDRPLHLTIEGTQRRVWLLFAGNGCFTPPGITPTWRARLDQGVLDVRLVSADRPLARTRVVLAALLRRLPNCPAYESRTVEKLDVEVRGEPAPLSRDGEVGDPVGRLAVRVRVRDLTVYHGKDG